MGSSAEAWPELFVAAAGADAALAGLVFVAVSINLDRILHLDGVPERALQTLTLLVGVVLVSFLGLTPQSSTALGIEIVVLGTALVALFARTLRATVRSVLGKPAWVSLRVALPALGSVPYVIGGISLIAQTGGGLYWVLAGMIAATLGAASNAWVLLVEILR